ncbi:hypothetical protein M9458_004572, partial [Cirrhinus mrigala]
AEKVCFLDAPISQVGLFGDTVEEFAQQFSMVKKQTEAIKHILLRRAVSANPALPRQQLSPAPRRGRPPARTAQALQQAGPAARPTQRPSTGHKEPSGEGQIDLPGSTLDEGMSVGLGSIPAVTRQTATTWSIKEQFPSSLGMFHSVYDPPCDGRTLFSLTRTCVSTPLVFPHVLKQRVCSDDLPRQGDPLVGSHQTNFLGKTDSGPRWLSGSGYQALHKLPFKMLTLKHILTCVRDAYFHVSILPRHRPFLRFALEGQAYQYKVLPFGLSLSPRVFTKVVKAALAPLREVGIRILNYIDDWLILAHSRDLVCAQRDVVLNHLACLGLRVNWEKSKLSPTQSISFLSVELDLVNMTAHLSQDRAHTQTQNSGPPDILSEAPGAHGIPSRGHAAGLDAHETTTALASYPSPEMGTYQDTVVEDIAFLRRIVVTTDASKTGWGIMCNGHAASGVWKGPRLLWHIICLELLTVLLALIQGKHVFIRTDNTATVAYINHHLLSLVNTLLKARAPSTRRL